MKNYINANSITKDSRQKRVDSPRSMIDNVNTHIQIHILVTMGTNLFMKVIGVHANYL